MTVAGSSGVAPEKIVYVSGTPVTFMPGEIRTAEAYCPAGTKAVGGGGLNSIATYAAGGVIGASIAAGSGWFIVANNETTIPIDVSAFAVCVAS